MSAAWVTLITLAATTIATIITAWLAQRSNNRGALTTELERLAHRVDVLERHSRIKDDYISDLRMQLWSHNIEPADWPGELKAAWRKQEGLGK